MVEQKSQESPLRFFRCMYVRRLRQYVLFLFTRKILLPRLLLPGAVRNGACAAMTENAMAFCAVMAQARSMLREKIISKADYEKINEMMLKKYNLPVTSIYQDLDLISKRVRGNITG